jgi:hypothetical protein
MAIVRFQRNRIFDPNQREKNYGEFNTDREARPLCFQLDHGPNDPWATRDAQDKRLKQYVSALSAWF